MLTLKKIFFTEKELKESMNDSCKEIIKKIAILKKLWPFLRADFFAFPHCNVPGCEISRALSFRIFPMEKVWEILIH